MDQGTALQVQEALKSATGLPNVPPPGVNVAGAVDLATLKYDKTKHGHRFIYVLQFGLPDATIKAIRDHKQYVADCVSRGEEPETANINLPLIPPNIVQQLGPGCIKCGKGLDDPTMQKLCEKSDDEFGIQGWPTQTEVEVPAA